jgi:hypothetical protein
MGVYSSSSGHGCCWPNGLCGAKGGRHKGVIGLSKGFRGQGVQRQVYTCQAQAPSG